MSEQHPRPATEDTTPKPGDRVRITSGREHGTIGIVLATTAVHPTHRHYLDHDAIPVEITVPHRFARAVHANDLEIVTDDATEQLRRVLIDELTFARAQGMCRGTYDPDQRAELLLDHHAAGRSTSSQPAREAADHQLTPDELITVARRERDNHAAELGRIRDDLLLAMPPGIRNAIAVGLTSGTATNLAKTAAQLIESNRDNYRRVLDDSRLHRRLTRARDRDHLAALRNALGLPDTDRTPLDELVREVAQQRVMLDREAQRRNDIVDEHRKASESWDRQRAQLQADHAPDELRVPAPGVSPYREVAHSPGVWEQDLELPPTPLTHIRDALTELARTRRHPISAILAGHGTKAITRITLVRDPSVTHGTPTFRECDRASAALAQLTGWSLAENAHHREPGTVTVPLGLREGYNADSPQHDIDDAIRYLPNGGNWVAMAVWLVSARHTTRSALWYEEPGVLIHAPAKNLPDITAAAADMKQDRFVVYHADDNRTVVLKRHNEPRPDALTCHLCGSDAGVASAEGPQQARRDAKRQGWTRRRIDGRYLDLCPDCSATDRDALHAATPTEDGGDR